MPRLLFLITDLELGGTPIVVRELALRLRGAHVHIEVACLKPAGVVAEQLRAGGVTVTSFNARRSLDFPQAVGALIDLIRERQIDTVFSFLVHANFIASRAARKLPSVRFLQSIQTTQPKPRWHWWLQRRIHRVAARVVVPSESVALRAMERANVPRAKLVVIPNAVDVDFFRGTQRDARETPFRVGFIGRLDPVKRIGDLLSAIALLPESFRLDVFGEGELRPQLEQAVRTSLANRVTLHGQIADARLALGAMDVLVLPSDAEGFGLVLIEAMAAGVPVIGTDVDGIHDVVTHEQTGLLVPPRNPEAIAAAITRMATDSNLRNQLVINAATEVERRFAWPAVLAAYRAVLQIDSL